jgi:hypothetical protein
MDLRIAVHLARTGEKHLGITGDGVIKKVSRALGVAKCDADREIREVLWRSTRGKVVNLVYRWECEWPTDVLFLKTELRIIEEVFDVSRAAAPEVVDTEYCVAVGEK